MLFDYELFRKNIKEIRTNKNMSEYEMAIQADINYTTYCNIERGSRKPSLKYVVNIANALNFSVTALISERKISKNNIVIENILFQLQYITDKNFLNGIYRAILVIKTRKVIDENV